MFCFHILILIYFFKYETTSTFAPTFWKHIISELDAVLCFRDIFLRHLGYTKSFFKNLVTTQVLESKDATSPLQFIHSFTVQI